MTWYILKNTHWKYIKVSNFLKIIIEYMKKMKKSVYFLSNTIL